MRFVLSMMLALVAATSHLGCDAFAPPQATGGTGGASWFATGGSSTGGILATGGTFTGGVGGSGGEVMLDLGTCTYDPTFELAVRSELARQHRARVVDLTDFRLSQPVSSLAGLECLENLTRLYLTHDPAAGEDLPPGSADPPATLDLSPAGTLHALHSVELQGLAFTHLEALERVTTLTLTGTPFDSLAPLAEFEQLVTLVLRAVPAGELPPLSGLTKLSHLYLAETEVGTFSFLNGLPTLAQLTLESVEFEDFTGFEDLPFLSQLEVRGSPFTSFAGMKNVPKLQIITVLDCMEVTSLAGLEACDGLLAFEAPGAAGSNIEDLGAIGSLPRLKRLTFHRALLSDLEPLRECTTLEWVALIESGVHDLGPLADHPSLAALYLSTNEIADIGPLAGLPLTILDLSDNQVESLDVLSDMPLGTLSISQNPIAALDPIATLSALKVLHMDAVGATSLEVLRGLPIIQLSARDNQISDVDALVQPFEHFDLTNNLITDLPAHFVGAIAGNCGAATLLEGNPLGQNAVALLQDLCVTQYTASYHWDSGRCDPLCPVTNHGAPRGTE